MKTNSIFEAMRDIDPQYIVSAAPRERGGARRGARIRTLVIAAAVAILAVAAAVPAMIKLTDLYTEPAEYLYLKDLPAVTREGGAATYSGYLTPLPKGGVSEDVAESELEKFFDTSELPFSDGLLRCDVRVDHNASNEFHSIRVRLIYEEGDVFFIIDPAYSFDAISSGAVPVTTINGYDIVMFQTYNVYRGETPVLTSGNTDIEMEKKDVAVLIVGENSCLERLEAVYNFLLNAEFDFEALKK